MFHNCLKWYILLLIGIFLQSAAAWDSDQLEIFDLVEEINQNFYTLLNVTQDADLSSIKRAFRGLSLILHPDKNDAPDADVQFRNLVSVYDVLKDTHKRELYDEVLRNGLPNWRSAVYYYRHVRKMGMMETLLTLFIVISIGQYLVSWGAYIEKKYVVEQDYNVRLKKHQKQMKQQKKKGNAPLEEIEKFVIPKPSIKCTLPIQIPKLIWNIITGIPSTVRLIKFIYEERQKHIKEQEIESSSDEEQTERDRPARKRKPGFVPIERDESELPPRPDYYQIKEIDESTNAPVASGGLWTDDDLTELSHLMKKYPGGTPKRWERIAETMHRAVTEVTYMATKMKENCYRIPDQEHDETQLEAELPKKQKTRAAPTTANDLEPSNWSQVQQKALESALGKYPKGPTDRWEKIAKCVPGKTKEECMIRYKYLVELIKKQKEKNDNNETDEQ